MNYLPNRNVSRWRTFFSGGYDYLRNKYRFIYQKAINKMRVAKLHPRMNRFVMLFIAFVILATTLFSITFIIITGILLFVINAVWYGLVRLFTGNQTRQKLS